MGKLIWKKRFWFLVAAIAVIAVIGFIYVACIGSTYEMLTGSFFGYEVDLDCFELTAETPGVVEVVDKYQDDGEIVFTLHSLSQGETDLSFHYLTDEGDVVRNNLHVEVNFLGTIFEHNEYRFSFNGFKFVICLFLFGMALVTGVMIYTFFDLRKKALYSHSMIASGGLALFCFVLILFIVYKLMNNVVFHFSIFVHLLGETGNQLLVVLSPVMLVLAVSISISNIWLIRHEGFRPVNALGIIFSIVWALAMIISSGIITFHIVDISNYRIIDGLNKMLIYLSCYFECLLLSTIACAHSASKHQPPYDRDFIIILGCAIRPDGSPTPLLRMRTDSAISFARRQAEATGKHAVFVPSGGQGSDEIISESESMRRYLIEQGIPEEQIAKEDKSKSTFENMKFSKEVIDARWDGEGDPKIAFATTNYHVFRGYILARKNNYQVQGISAKTKWYFFPNAFLREFVGLLVDRKFHHLASVILFIFVFIGFSMIQ